MLRRTRARADKLFAGRLFAEWRASTNESRRETLGEEVARLGSELGRVLGELELARGEASHSTGISRELHADLGGLVAQLQRATAAAAAHARDAEEQRLRAQELEHVMAELENVEEEHADAMPRLQEAEAEVHALSEELAGVVEAHEAKATEVEELEEELERTAAEAEAENERILGELEESYRTAIGWAQCAFKITSHLPRHEQARLLQANAPKPSQYGPSIPFPENRFDGGSEDSGDDLVAMASPKARDRAPPGTPSTVYASGQSEEGAGALE